MRYLASLLRHPRVGVIVPRHGHTAVDRNTVKRRLREIAREELLPVLGGVDVVLRASPAAYGAPIDVLRSAVRQAMRQLPLRATEDAL